MGLLALSVGSVGPRGYTICEVTPERWLATFRAVADQFDENSAVVDATVWEVIAGTPGVAQVV